MRTNLPYMGIARRRANMQSVEGIGYDREIDISAVLASEL
jgi:hypothetical protein